MIKFSKLAMTASIAMLTAACSMPEPGKPIAMKIAQEIRDSKSADGKVVLHPKGWVEGWEYLVIMPPQSAKEDFALAIQEDMRVQNAKIGHRDDISLLVFMKEGTPVEVVAIPVTAIDFRKVASSRITPDDCIALNAEGQGSNQPSIIEYCEVKI